MQTNSVVIKKITAFLFWLNYYFEYSLIYKCLQAVKNASKGSRILNDFFNQRDYWQGSLILRFFAFIVGWVFLYIGRFCRFIARINENSLNKKIFVFCMKKAESLGISLKTIYMFVICVTLIIPSTAWNNRYLMLSAVFFSFVYAVKWFLSEERKPQFSHISPALCLFVFFCALSIFTGYGGMDSFRVFIIFFACVVHSVLIMLIFKEKEDFQLFFIFIAITLTITAFFGFYQFYNGIEIRSELVDLGASPGLSRLESSMGNSNNDAQVWAMLLPFIIAVCITVKNDTKRLVLMGMVFVVLVAFALSYSRSGYVAFMVGLGVFVLMTAPRIVPVALVVLILALPFVPAGIIERLLTLGSDTSSQYRFLIWGGVMRMLEDFWIQGIGMGPAAFIRIYRGYAHPLAERAMHSHTMFFDIIVHSGIGAFLAFLAYIFKLFKRGVSSFAASDDMEYKIYISAGIAALTVFAALGVGEYVWFYPRVMFVFWIVAGLILGMARIREKA